MRGKEEEVQDNLPLQQIPLYSSPFFQRLKEKAKDGKFTKFITMIKIHSQNSIPPEDIENNTGYSKFMKDVVKNKEL